MFTGTTPPVERVVAAVEHLDDSDGEEVETSVNRPHSSGGPRLMVHTTSSKTGNHGQPTPPIAATTAVAGPPPANEGATCGNQEDGSPAPSLAVAAAMVGAAGSASQAASLHISAPDYTDRQRLLYHITYLSTQLQRAQLQLQEHARTIVILQAIAAAATAASNQSNGNGGETQHTGEVGAGTTTIVLPAPSASTTAAVLAARNEQEVHAALSSSLPLFDPLLAQDTIYRLDSAVAQLSLLREAETERLAAAEAELVELRAARVALAGRVDSLTADKEALEKEKGAMRDGWEAMREEIQGLRAEEARLVRKVAGLEQLMADGTLMDGVRVVGGKGEGSARKQSASSSSSSSYLHQQQQQREALMEEETSSRQALLQQQFWSPMLIAFDAGLTWLSESALLKDQLRQLQAVTSRQERTDADTIDAEAFALLPDYRYSQQQRTRRSGGGHANGVGDAVVLPPPTDADLLLMRSQQDEIIALKARLGMHQERLRMAQLETDRLRFLYEGEQRRSESLAATHSRQLQQAYEEIMKDRALLAEQLRAEVEEQVRVAFHDGRRYEHQRMKLRQTNHSINAGAGGTEKGRDGSEDTGEVFTDIPLIFAAADSGRSGSRVGPRNTSSDPLRASRTTPGPRRSPPRSRQSRHPVGGPAASRPQRTARQQQQQQQEWGRRTRKGAVSLSIRSMAPADNHTSDASSSSSSASPR